MKDSTPLSFFLTAKLGTELLSLSNSTTCPTRPEFNPNCFPNCSISCCILGRISVFNCSTALAYRSLSSGDSALLAR
uniref:Uncharacterized protein n=1 Tax=Pseudoalteromonas sp. PAMC 21150 TaxID=1716625 RepID=A0A0M4QA34_9GAMM|nr:hypothetical protein [Pseudoalteromonas sp. PAMC 21150]